MFYKVGVVINVCGLLCPEPMIVIRKGLRYMSFGEIMLILADDPSIKRDILMLSRFMRHSLLMKMTKRVPYCYLLQKNREG